MSKEKVAVIGRPSPKLVLHEALDRAEDMDSLALAYINKEGIVHRTFTGSQGLHLHCLTNALFSLCLDEFSFEDE